MFNYLTMYMDEILRLTAGVVLLILSIVGYLTNNISLLFTVIFVLMALNQIQSAFTNWCPIVWLYKKLGVKECKK